ncbi:MAG TPA: ATP-binding protein [Syntrophomonadaceae bacterium]|nr:ATP-binding protein [Syntrophomonadaceae bacterium]
MRIAISGAHGVGKTTLAKSLAAKLNLPLVEEVARSVAAENGFKTTTDIQNAVPSARALYQHSVFFRQVMKEDYYHRGYVSDRSVFDCVAYCILYDLHHDFISFLRAEAIKHSSDYDFIVYCPIPSNGIADDGFRLTDQESQKMINDSIQTLLKFAKCPVLRLGENRERWEEEVLEYIRGRKG